MLQEEGCQSGTPLERVSPTRRERLDGLGLRLQGFRSSGLQSRFSRCRVHTSRLGCSRCPCQQRYVKSFGRLDASRKLFPADPAVARFVRRMLKYRHGRRTKVPEAVNKLVCWTPGVLDVRVVETKGLAQFEKDFRYFGAMATMQKQWNDISNPAALLVLLEREPRTMSPKRQKGPCAQSPKTLGTTFFDAVFRNA